LGRLVNFNVRLIKEGITRIATGMPDLISRQGSQARKETL
jgi:hypothetical protein